MAEAIVDTGQSIDVFLWDDSRPLNAANAFMLDQLGLGSFIGSSL